MGSKRTLSTEAAATRTKRNRTQAAALCLILGTDPFCVPLLRFQMPPMRTDQPRINVRRAALIFVAGIITASCSEKPAPDREKDVNASEAPREMVRESEVETAEGGDEPQPGKDEIEEDCAAFVRSTKVVPARAAATDCPGCPAGGTAVLAFRGMKTEAVSCS